jgi:rod shape determining protein RodA
MIAIKDIGRQILRMDMVMLLMTIVLMVMGVFFVYSAGYQHNDLPIHGLYKRQIVWVLVGLCLYLTTAFIDYERIGDFAPWIYIGSILLVVAVLIFGTEISGAKRWLNLGIKIQPSEFAKIGLLVFLASYLSGPGRSLEDFPYVLASLIICAVPFLLIAKQPDLGTALVLIAITFGVLFVARIPYRYLFLLVALGLLMLPLLWQFLHAYQQDRILIFLDPGRDPLGGGWSRLQSMMAVGSGGVTGKGYLQGTQGILGFLPLTVAPTDFIYSVIAEETGFLGTVVVFSLYIFLFAAIVRAAIHARDRLGRLIAVGVLVMLFTHVTVNIAMTIGLLPITGLPLPLLSYGGSFTFSTMIALGLVQSVYIRRVRPSL